MRGSQVYKSPRDEVIGRMKIAEQRAEAAEATVASLRQLVTKWYEAADADLEAGNKQYGHALDQCADELDAALAALPTPSTKP